jgi:hypothetical protein
MFFFKKVNKQINDTILRNLSEDKEMIYNSLNMKKRWNQWWGSGRRW